jgi:branched-chain amino acid transport system substrate-binding protein
MRSYLLSVAATVLLLAFAVGCTGCKGEKGDTNTIKIVSSLPRTGSAKGQTDTIVNGIKLALEEAGNKAGNFKIVYEDLDDATAIDGKWTADKESANAEQATKDPDVMIYIGPYNSGAAAVSIPILNKVDLLMISPACSAPGLTKPGTGEPGEPEKYRGTGGKINFTRVVPADDLQGPLGADWAKDMGVKSVYILHDNEVYGKGIASLFQDRCKELNITVLGFQAVDYKQSDFKTLMGDIAKMNPDLLYFGGTSQSGAPQIVKDMVNQGMAGKCKLMVPDGCFEDAFITGAGVENFGKLACYVTFGGMPPNQLTGKGKEFVEKYKAKYGNEPEAYAVYGYEAAKVALAAVEKAGKKDRADILKAALAIRDFDGATGKWSFDANGDTTLTTMSGSKIDAKGIPQFERVLKKK